jgi:hypothetical protein
MKAPSRDQLLADVLSDATWREIAAKYGYSDPRFLRKLARRYDLPQRRVIRKPSEEQLRAMIRDEGLTPYQIAERLGYGSGGWSNIYAYCREYGIAFDFSRNHALRAVPFTQRQKEIALGSLLGDAYLRPSGNSYCLSFTHGERQKAYLEWKLAEFDNFVVTKDFYRSVREFRGNAPTYTFSTITHPYLRALRDLCYPEGKKRVTMPWLEQLTPLSLAVWFLDDGSRNRRYGTITLCTNSFSYDEQELMRSVFLSRFGLDARIEPRRNGQFNLRINASRAGAFLALIAPHVPDCMVYKLG